MVIEKVIEEIPFVREMFDKVAPKYDLLNRLLSLRQDVYWRRVMVSAIDILNKGIILDVACGSGDVALEIKRQKGQNAVVFGIDFSLAMLSIAKEKVRRIPDGENIHLVAGNAFNIPFKADTFDVATMAFGIRNIKDRVAALKVLHENLKIGGMLLVLELTTPEKGPLLSLYLFYFKKMLPFIGGLFSGDLNAYKYLPLSVANFPRPAAFAETMRLAGFSNIKWKKLTLGIATLFVGYKN